MASRMVSARLLAAALGAQATHAGGWSCRSGRGSTQSRADGDFRFVYFNRLNLAVKVSGGFTHPDGTSLLIGPERFRAPEVLFRPELVGSEARGAHECVSRAILLADLDLL